MVKLSTILFLSLLFLTCIYAAAKYKVKATRANDHKPLCSSQERKSIFTFNYNPSYLDIRVNGKKIGEGLLVRSQNVTTPPYDVGPSVLTIAKSTTGNLDNPAKIEFTEIKLDDVIFDSVGKSENYGVEDPRITYREKDQTYYMFYTAAEQTKDEIIAKLALATTKNILDKNSWVRHGTVFPEWKWSKSGSLLLRDDVGGPHILIWGDEDLRLAYTEDFIHYQPHPVVFLPRRADKFDSHLVEAGPSPVRLSDGNYLYIYNSAQEKGITPRPNYTLEYNAGWAILDSNNPGNILQRCEEPLLSPVLDWETGKEPYLGLVPRVVFVEALKPLGNDKFLVFYGAADSVIGSAVVSVEIEKNGEHKIKVDKQ